MLKFRRYLIETVSVFLIIAFCATYMSTVVYAEEYSSVEVDTETVEFDDIVIEQNGIIEENDEDGIQPAAYDEPSYPNGYKNADIENGIYYIRNMGNGKYIDIHGPNTEMVHQWSYHSGMAENWQIIEQSDGTYVIKSLYQNKYIGIANTNYGVDNINLYSNISNNTKWVILQKNIMKARPMNIQNTFLFRAII